MKKKINVGIIGKNFGLKVILKAFRKNKRLNVVGISSLNKPENSVLMSEKISFYPDWKKMVDNKSINAVAIAAPPKTQKAIIIYSLSKNKHIFCEKPFTESYTQAEKIVKILKKKRKIVNIVNYIFPEIDQWKILKQKIKKKVIKHADLKWTMNSKFNKRSWKFKHNQGGGVLYNFACHSIYYLEYLFGRVNFLKSKVLYKNKNLPYRVIGVLYFFSGVRVAIDINLFSKKKNIHQLLVKTNKNNFQLSSNVNRIYDKFDLRIKQNKRKIFKLKRIKNFKKEDFRIDPTYKNSIKFSKWILNKKEYKPNFTNALRVHYILGCILKSSKSKKNISI